MTQPISRRPLITRAWAPARPDAGRLGSDGNGGANYTITLANNTSGQITAKPLAVTGIEAGDKVYDGTTNATLVVSNAVLVGVVGSEDVQLSTTNAAGGFTNRNIGVGQLVQVSGLEFTAPILPTTR